MKNIETITQSKSVEEVRSDISYKLKDFSLFYTCVMFQSVKMITSKFTMIIFGWLLSLSLSITSRIMRYNNISTKQIFSSFFSDGIFYLIIPTIFLIGLSVGFYNWIIANSRKTSDFEELHQDYLINSEVDVVQYWKIGKNYIHFNNSEDLALLMKDGLIDDLLYDFNLSFWLRKSKASKKKDKINQYLKTKYNLVDGIDEITYIATKSYINCFSDGYYKLRILTSTKNSYVIDVNKLLNYLRNY